MGTRTLGVATMCENGIARYQFSAPVAAPGSAIRAA